MAKTLENFICGKLIYSHSLQALVSCANDENLNLAKCLYRPIRNMAAIN